MPDKKMQDKRVLVTGAGTGVGRGIALEFAREGAKVVVHYSSSATGAEEVVKEISGMGGSAAAVHADLNSIDEINQLADEAVKFLGGLDVLVNNAGITLTEPFEKVTPEQFDEIYNVNIRAMFFLTQKLTPVLAKQKSSAVVNVSSIHAYSGMIDHTVYAGTKGAIVAYTRTLALELIKQGIRVNTIAPGWILVEKHKAALPTDFDYEAAANLIPVGFIGQPEDAGQLAIFFASEASKYIIGQTLMLDGGQSLVMPLAAQVCELFGGAPPSRKE